MTCDRCRDLMTDYAHGELDAATDAAVFAHLDSCADCKAVAAEDTALTETIRRAYAREMDLPTSVIAGVRQAVRTPRQSTWLPPLRTWWRPAVLAPTAAMLLLVVSVVRYNTVHSAQPPQLSADYLVREHLVQTMGSQSHDRTYSEYLLTSANDQQSNAVAP